MRINDYEEKRIRKAIEKKVNPSISNSKSKHQKGKIYIKKKVVAIVKIPNDHKKIMKQSKSQYIANALKLTYDEFNSLIECPLTGPNYYKLLEDKIENKS